MTANAAIDDTTPEFWDIRDIQFHCRIGRTRAWELVREPGFPPPVALGRRRIWPRGDVLAFLETLKRSIHYPTAVNQSDHVPYLVREVRHRSP